MAEIKVPDIGDFDAVEVIEILARVGDVVCAEDPLLTLESDKATMEIPAPGNGTITEIKIAVGENVSEGMVIMRMDADRTAEAEAVSPEGIETWGKKPSRNCIRS